MAVIQYVVSTVKKTPIDSNLLHGVSLEPVAEERLCSKKGFEIMEISQNARTVLERRYLAKDGEGKPTETVERCV